MSGERPWKTEHDRHHDQRQHQQADIRWSGSPGHEQGDGEQDDRHQGKTETQFFFHDFFSCLITYSSSLGDVFS